MPEILWLSGLLLLVSGLFLLAGYQEHKRSLLVLDNISYLILNVIQEHEEKRYGTEKHEGTDTE